MSYIDELKRDALSALAGGKVRVYAKTNLGPHIPVYTGTEGGDGLLEKLGVRGGLIVTDETGKTLYTVGDPAKTDPVRSLVFWLFVALILSVLLRGLLK